MNSPNKCSAENISSSDIKRSCSCYENSKVSIAAKSRDEQNKDSCNGNTAQDERTTGRSLALNLSGSDSPSNVPLARIQPDERGPEE